MKDLSLRRLAENEVFFRQQNESIEEGFEHLRTLAAEDSLNHYIEDDDSPLYFYCECADENCRLRVEVKPSMYTKIHERRDQFVILPNHEVFAVEEIVDKEPGYHVVRKTLQPPSSTDMLHDTDINNV